MPRVVVSLGSNVDALSNLPLALERLATLGRIEAVSRVYASPAYGPPGQPDFLNAAVALTTDQSALELRESLRALEADLGRVRTSDRYAPRPIDLDLVLYDDLLSDEPPLLLPDPELLTRDYLAVTAAEVHPGWRHPHTGEPLSAIADRLRKKGSVRLRQDVHLEANSAPKGNTG